MAKDYLRRVAGFQCQPVHVLNFRKSVGDERVTKRVLFPGDAGSVGRAPHCFEEAIFAAWPDALSIARRYRQPAGKIL